MIEPRALTHYARVRAPPHSLTQSSTPLGRAWLFTLAVCAVGCSAGQGARQGSQLGTGGASFGAGGSGTGGVPLGAGGSGASAGGVVIGQSGSTGDAGGGGVDACATQKADAVIMREPVDIIVIIDNSGSMQDEIDAVERSINVNFANILSASGVDYRVILLSRHERPGRATSICVEAPLSGNPTCTPQPPEPVFSSNFFQYSLKIESTDSLVLILSTYSGASQDEFDLAPLGWSSWLRPGAKKVFLEITDDNSTDMTSQAFDSALLALSPENFGTAANRKYTFHSIIGLAEKVPATSPYLANEAIQLAKCNGNGDSVTNAGPVYQELSILTGGLRFPICQFTAFDVVFQTIAQNVTSHAQITCDFPIPPPPADRTLDLSKVAVAYDPGDGSGVQTFGQAMTPDACVPNAFYIDQATQRIVLCPDACTSVQGGLNPSVNVLFTCEPTFIPPPK